MLHHWASECGRVAFRVGLGPALDSGRAGGEIRQLYHVLASGDENRIRALAKHILEVVVAVQAEKTDSDGANRSQPFAQRHIERYPRGAPVADVCVPATVPIIYNPIEAQVLFGWLEPDDAGWRLRHMSDCGHEDDVDLPGLSWWAYLVRPHVPQRG